MIINHQLYAQAYNAECDGYDRAWHVTIAKSFSDRESLRRGAEDAARDLKAIEDDFKPGRLLTAPILEVDFG